MERLITNFSSTGKQRATSFLIDYLKDDLRSGDTEVWNLEQWLKEILDRVSDRTDEHKPEYELSPQYSFDNTPKLLSFKDNDFEYELLD